MKYTYDWNALLIDMQENYTLNGNKIMIIGNFDPLTYNFSVIVLSHDLLGNVSDKFNIEFGYEVVNKPVDLAYHLHSYLMGVSGVEVKNDYYVKEVKFDKYEFNPPRDKGVKDRGIPPFEEVLKQMAEVEGEMNDNDEYEIEL